MVHVKNLVKKYDELTAVDNISFDVIEGEIFGLLGPNGAGKTTTMEIIETLREPDGGEVIIDGLNLAKDKEKIKHIIGVQLQQSGFYPNLNLRELIKLFAGLYNVPASAGEILKMVSLEEKSKSIIKNLSGGQKQRFAVAVTLINKPKIIFLDEPTTGLDPQARRNMWDMIRNIRQAGTTVMMTTHYMDEAEKLCDRVGIMDNGKIIAIDTPDGLIDTLLKNGFERTEKIRHASLEDVFLSLTGRELRDE